MSQIKIIHDAAIDLMLKRAVRASDGYRLWFYADPPRDYSVSQLAESFVVDGIKRGLSAAEIDQLSSGQN